MAKVTGPLMSMDASGAFGGTLVFAKWKGRPTVRQFVTPSNPQTASQMAARNKVRVTGAAQNEVNISIQKKTGQTLTDKQLLINKAPSGFAWNGFLTDTMIGTGGLNYTNAGTAYTALSTTEKTTWDTAAQARVPPYVAVTQQGAGGVASANVVKGEVYFREQYAMFVAGIFPSAPTAVPPTYA